MPMKPKRMLWPLALLALTACASRNPAGTTVTTMPTTQGQQVVVVEPAASARGEVRQLKLPPLAAANVRDGDDVSLNVVVRPRP